MAEKIWFGNARTKADRGEYEVYTYEEARALGIVPVIWREAVGRGWVLTDDGYVVFALGVHVYVEKKYTSKAPRVRRVIRTVIGSYWGVGGQVLLWERVRVRRVQHAYGPVRWLQREMRRTRTRQMVKLYAMMLCAGKVDWHVLSVIWRPDQLLPGYRLKKLLKEEEILEMVSKETFALMQRKGVNAEYVIDKMMKAVELAEVKGDGNTILRACEDFRQLLGMERALSDGSVGSAQVVADRDADFEDTVAKAERELRGEKGTAQGERALLPGGVGE